MGCSSSRLDRSEALRLCKERKRFIKEAIDSRYAFTAAHLSYVESLKSIGIALRRFAEAEVLIESSLSATEVDKTPSHSSYPSPSPSHNAELVDSPLHNESPHLPNVSNISYMKSSRSDSVTVKLEPSLSRFGEEESINFPPPPPFPEIGSSWDFFDPSDEAKSLQFIAENGFRQYSMGEVDVDCNGENSVGSIGPGSEQRGAKLKGNSAPPSRNRDMVTRASSCNLTNFITSEEFEDAQQSPFDDGKLLRPERIKSIAAVPLVGDPVLKQSSLKRENTEAENDLGEEREDPSDFITHRAKDFLSSIKDIEHRFFRASESGKEVSRMLEANKIPLRRSEAKGRSSSLVFLAAFHLACCQGDNVIPNDPPEQMPKFITWHRSVSSRSSSSKNPLAAPKDDISDSGSDFAEEFCMITGSHSSTLDRLYAWERKLYDEVKASEYVRRSYDHWCAQLRHQFARDASAQVIDKTRSVVKDLHSQLRVALHAVDSIAKRIERMRDEELQPQLVELIQGLIRMWKVVLECHHAQYITISLAYYTKSSTMGPVHKESQKQVIAQLQHEIECFGSSFRDWNDAHRSYVEALNGWLQTCIVLPQERSRGRRAFSPRRVVVPPIFVICRDWSAGIKTLPSGEVINAIKAFVSDLHASLAQHVEEQKSKGLVDSTNNDDAESKEEEQSDKPSNLSNTHTSLTKVLDRLTKFAEALRKIYEDTKQGTEAAQVAYANYKTTKL
ncbi:Nitrate regulatory gene2 protein [Thalictrum thalictroides]|uniref:Nitrate regulatory gene2 protein n=1 Tax=Thalictrum thalictroides TaxID=46969 RepID=A0A7J6W4P6_THATH|nr:Nitrate regulatory gene2 protein [Thalictrum thalictroides]